MEKDWPGHLVHLLQGCVTAQFLKFFPQLPFCGCSELVWGRELFRLFVCFVFLIRCKERLDHLKKLGLTVDQISIT